MNDHEHTVTPSAVVATETSRLAAEIDALKRQVAALEAMGRASRPPKRWIVISPTRFALLAIVAASAAFVGGWMAFGQAKADVLFITPEGNVGIGTSAPTQKLDVAGAIRSSTGGFQFPDGTTQATSDSLTGAVVAFNRARCPRGWTEYAPAYGRFIRGIDNSGAGIDPGPKRSLGSLQEDAIRNITGAVTGVAGTGNRAWQWGFHPGTTGALSVAKEIDGYNRYAGDYNPPGGAGSTATFDASRVVPTAGDNRPKNVALLYCTKS